MADGEVPAEEKLRKLEEQTKQWKEIVVAQLNEAANKNKLLREELRVLRAEKDAAVTEVRLQLSQEFKERTGMLREEVAQLQAAAAQLREENHLLAAQHEEALAATERRMAEMRQVDAAQERARAAAETQKVEADLRAQLQRQAEAQQAMEHEAEVLRDRLGRVTAQYQELSELLRHHDSKAADDRGGGGATADGTASDAAHQHQLERVKAELASKALDTQRQLQEADRRYQAEREAALLEQQRREDQLAVAQALLRQSQADLSALQRRLSHSETERQSTERHFAAKVASLSKELAAALDGAREAQQHEAAMRAQTEGLHAHIKGLEEEAESREAAFRALMLSEDEKTLVHELRAALQESADRADSWKAKYYSTLEGTPSPFKRAKSPDGGSAAGELEPGDDSPAPGDRERDAQRALELREREAALAAQAADLARKAALLQVAEAKLSETKRQVAEQANLLLLLQQKQQQQPSARPGTGSPPWRASPPPEGPGVMLGLDAHVPHVCRVGTRRLIGKPRVLLFAGLFFVVFVMLMISSQ
ncbi:hypothetical protein STCU_05087 [Strigomonas culicis]|uniref:Uncharacterized protein n=1 Tax=Strigomonas culicis TaxID=28005 RepID=S9UHU5_9TRYP|nr:hypothetical protein STCU_05087 [Strigomonas culicis]|eukprot:EPY28493.1 hypothetical protein STCU_05087 [Strigomonas culicis]